jgi:hypothetical protein
LIAADAQGGFSADDLRIAAEQVVVLLGRLLPFVDSIVADLYMTDVSEIECEDRRTIEEEQRQARATLIRSLVSQLDEVTKRDVTNRRWRILAVLDMAVILAAIHAEAVAVLRDILVDRLAPGREIGRQ